MRDWLIAMTALRSGEMVLPMVMACVLGCRSSQDRFSRAILEIMGMASVVTSASGETLGSSGGIWTTEIATASVAEILLPR